MSKASVNAILKEAGLGFVKMDLDTMGYESKCVKGHDGKRINGIHLSSHSPMDVTSVAGDRVRSKTNEVHNKLRHLTQVNDSYVVEETARTRTTLYLATERHRSYARSVGYDEGYQSSYLVPYFTKEKK